MIETERMHDVAVIGLGLIGSAAVRHLAEAGVDVVGIGPSEPDDWLNHDGPFSSHYDSGRVTRRTDAQREWAILASRSIEQYPIIESQSGITFHTPCGHLFVRNDSAGIANQRAVAEELKIPIRWGTTASLPYEGLTFPDGFTTLHEPGPAGYVDPRKLIAAQHAIATAHSARLIDSHATSIKRAERAFEIVHGSTTTLARRVLISTGAYANDLLPKPLALSVRPEAVVLAEVAEPAPLMPSIIFLLSSDDFDDTYFVPPTLYPDGKLYLKMGASHQGVEAFTTRRQMNEWMQGAKADLQKAPMRAVVESVLSGMDFLSWHMKPCLISDTASGLPFVDEIDDGLFVAVGGNGHAAKSSDALGALAARLVREGSWTDSDLDESAFAAAFGEHIPNDGSRHGN